MDPRNERAPFAPEAERYWGPVDLYVGGAAHAVMHLLYARFWHKVLFDAGLVHTKEPFQRLFNQGMVTAFAYEDASGRLVSSAEVEARGERFLRKGTDEPLAQIVTKMAKSLGNVVNPDDIIAEYGVDAFRLYEVFMGPLADSKPWNPRDIPGCRRFLERLWRVYVDPDSDARVRPQLAAGAAELALEGDTAKLERALHKAIQRTDDAFQDLNLNTAVASFMSFVNEVTRNHAALSRSQGERLLRLVAPFAPHVAEELWSRMGLPGLACQAAWPAAESRWLTEDEVEIAVQVNGRVRGTARVARDADRDAQEAAARAAVPSHLAGQNLAKVVVVPGKLVNFVVRG
jgi:leucyl-tRNA synthetase